MTTQPTPRPDGATVHLGGTAYAHAALKRRLVPIDDAVPYPGNPRRGDQEAITGSIRDLGLYAGVILQRSTGHILVGNHRRHGVAELGGVKIPADYLDVDDARAAAIVARDNLTSDLGGYNDRELLALLTADDEILPLSGYDDESLVDIRRALANLDFAEEAALAGIGDPVSDHSDPIDTEGDVDRVTVTVDAGARQKLYQLLTGVDYVRDVSDTHTRKPA